MVKIRIIRKENYMLLLFMSWYISTRIKLNEAEFYQKRNMFD